MHLPDRVAALLIADPDTALVARTALECAGFRCEVHRTAAALLRAGTIDATCAVVVDAKLPLAALAADVARRRASGRAAVLVVVGDRDATGVGRSLDQGADDFVALPLRGAELVARVGAALRRRRAGAVPPTGPGVSLGGCSLDPAARAIVSEAANVALTARELALARLLFDHPGQVVPHVRLAREIGAGAGTGDARAIEQTVYQLRRKLRRCAGDSLALRGVYGSGYRIEAMPAAPMANPGPAVAMPAATPPRPTREALAFAHAASEIARRAIDRAAP